jgi:hypothetical protein
MKKHQKHQMPKNQGFPNFKCAKIFEVSESKTKKQTVVTIFSSRATTEVKILKISNMEVMKK